MLQQQPDNLVVPVRCCKVKGQRALNPWPTSCARTCLGLVHFRAIRHEKLNNGDFAQAGSHMQGCDAMQYAICALPMFKRKQHQRYVACAYRAVEAQSKHRRVVPHGGQHGTPVHA